ncbi:hypothetical protein V8C44DRAFT_278194 [Trichoderma aethiopicum]
MSRTHPGWPSLRSGNSCTTTTLLVPLGGMGEVTWPSYEYLYNHPTALELGFVCLLACLLCYRDSGRLLGLGVCTLCTIIAPPAPSAPAPVPAPAPAPAWRLPMCLSACLSVRLYCSSSNSSSSRRSCEWRWTIRQLIPKKRCQRKQIKY